METKNAKYKLIMEWNKKYGYLRRIIKELEDKKESGYLISSFILNAQLVEYRLKKEINLMRSYINSHTDSDIKLSTKSVEEIEEEKMTLGSLIIELDRYEGELLNKLKKTLKELLQYRNRIVHKLFNIGELTKNEKDALEGNQLATDALNEMEKISYLTSGDYDQEKYGDNGL